MPGCQKFRNRLSRELIDLNNTGIISDIFIFKLIELESFHLEKGR